MASIQKRQNKFIVITSYKDEQGKYKQKWETFASKAEAVKRKKEIEYKQAEGTFAVPKCTKMKDLLKEYVELYGRENWSVSTYDSNTALIRNYILPLIGDVKIEDITTFYLDKFYQKLQETPAVAHPIIGRPLHDYVTPSNIRDIHKLLHSCFAQARKWKLISENPDDDATVPKYQMNERTMWTEEELQQATDACEDDTLALALNLAFAATLRIGEMLGLTWDCVDISREAVEQGKASVTINKTLQRVTKDALEELDKKDILVVFPERSGLCKTVRVLKNPKTAESNRTVYISRDVIDLLTRWKEQQNQIKEVLGDEYQDYGLVFATSSGLPIGDATIRKKMKRLIKEQGLPDVDFHSIRHASITIKLKITGGDIKSVQGDSGHAQASMVTEVYSHVLDEDRKKTAQLLQEHFYDRKHKKAEGTAETGNTIAVPDGIDPELVRKLLADPEALAQLQTMLAQKRPEI